jgi:hypothetical protein
MKRIAILVSLAAGLAAAAPACGGKSKPAEGPTGGAAYGGATYGTLSGEAAGQGYGGAAYGGAGYGDSAYQPTEFSPPLADWSTECNAYKAEIQRYASCDKVTPEARAALADASTAMDDGLKQMQDPSITDAVRQQVAGACRQATAALQQALASIGCK